MVVLNEQVKEGAIEENELEVANGHYKEQTVEVNLVGETAALE